MLHHGNVAFVGLLFKLGLIFLDIAELHLLILFGRGINRRTCEGGIERRFAFGFIAVTNQLHIDLRIDGLRPLVDDLVLYGDVIGATADHEGFDQLDPIDRCRLKTNLEFLGPVGQFALARSHGHRGFVGGHGTATSRRDQTGLGQVNTLTAFIKQHH